MRISKCDSKGRLYLKEALRSRYGDKFIVVETGDAVTLRPVPDDPVADLQLLGKALKSNSIKTIKKRILTRARKEVA